MNSQLAQLLDLSLSEKLLLVEDLWDHIAATPDVLPIPEWQKEELAKRKANYEKNPDTGLTWAEAKRTIRGQDG
jgi:putative addiction module component (TIGR02574 family)